MFDELCENYPEWGYMDPRTFMEWGNDYVDAGGECWTLLEGTTNDNQALFGDGMPTVIAIVENTNTWNSTLQIRAWEHDDTPALAWDVINFCSDEMGTMDDEEYADKMFTMLSELRETE